MYRSNTCGELRLSDTCKDVTLAGWVQRSELEGRGLGEVAAVIEGKIIVGKQEGNST